MELCRVPIPVPGPDELLVRVLATGICGSDLATFRGTHPYKVPPAVLGHEFCGVVEEVGGAVDSFAAGDLVCATAFAPCAVCDQCRSGSVNRCTARRNLSHAGWDGSFAEFVITTGTMTFRLPDRIDPVVGALVEPLAIGRHAVGRVGAAQVGRTAAVLGTGMIGLACAVAARQAGFTDILCVDLGPAKEQLARAAGANRYLDARAVDPATAAAGTAAVTIVASGHPGAVDQAVAMTAPGGTVVVVSYFSAPHAIDMNAVLARELTISAASLCTPEDVDEVIGWLTQGSVDPAPLVTHRFGLDAADAAMRLMDDPTGDVGKVMLIAATDPHTRMERAQV